MQDEWRIQMLPLKLLVLNVWPLVDLRLKCKSGGRDYPPEVPNDITKVLELDIVSSKIKTCELTKLCTLRSELFM